MRRQPDLVVNGLRLPVPVGAQITQDYEDFGGFAPLRFASGAALVQESWRKARTVIAASGLFPPGLAAVDWAAPVTLGCVATRSRQAAGNVINVLGNYRTDAPPYGFAVLPGDRYLPTQVAMAGNVATLTAVAGALAYQILWYPAMTVIAPAGVQISWDAQGAVASWRIEAEEM